MIIGIQNTIVFLAVAVIINTVTGFAGPRVYGGVVIITVCIVGYITIWGGTCLDSIHQGIAISILITVMIIGIQNTIVFLAVAVIINTVTGFAGPRVYGGVVIITVCIVGYIIIW